MALGSDDYRGRAVNAAETAVPVVQVERATGLLHAPSEWPAKLPAVSEVLQHGLTLGPLTVLIGENGSGKSTLVEGVAQAYGLSAEGGSTGARHTLTDHRRDPRRTDPGGRRVGLREQDWGELEMVRNWQAFLDNPSLYLRHVID